MDIIYVPAEHVRKVNCSLEFSGPDIRKEISWSACDEFFNGTFIKRRRKNRVNQFKEIDPLSENKKMCFVLQSLTRVAPPFEKLVINKIDFGGTHTKECVHKG